MLAAGTDAYAVVVVNTVAGTVSATINARVVVAFFAPVFISNVENFSFNLFYLLYYYPGMIQ